MFKETFDDPDKLYYFCIDLVFGLIYFTYDVHFYIF